MTAVTNNRLSIRILAHWHYVYLFKICWKDITGKQYCIIMLLLSYQVCFKNNYFDFHFTSNVNSSLSRPPDCTWHCPPGCPGNKCLDQLRDDSTVHRRPLEACCLPWTEWCKDTTSALTSSEMILQSIGDLWLWRHDVGHGHSGAKTQQVPWPAPRWFYSP